jgi:hypothetical protein
MALASPFQKLCLGLTLPSFEFASLIRSLGRAADYYTIRLELALGGSRGASQPKISTCIPQLQ